MAPGFEFSFYLRFGLTYVNMLTKNRYIVQKMLCFSYCWKKKTHLIFKYLQSFPGKQQTLIWLNHFEQENPNWKKNTIPAVFLPITDKRSTKGVSV